MVMSIFVDGIVHQRFLYDFVMTNETENFAVTYTESFSNACEYMWNISHLIFPNIIISNKFQPDTNKSSQVFFILSTATDT